MKLSINNTCVYKSKNNMKYFSSIYLLRNKVGYVVYRKFLLKLFCDILKMNFHIDFKWGSINFHKQRKRLAKYQLLGIAPVSLILVVLEILCNRYIVNDRSVNLFANLTSFDNTSKGNIWKPVFLTSLFLKELLNYD